MRTVSAERRRRKGKKMQAASLIVLHATSSLGGEVAAREAASEACPQEGNMPGKRGTCRRAEREKIVEMGWEEEKAR